MFNLKRNVAAVAAVLAASPVMAFAAQGPSSSASNYLLPSASGLDVTSILTAGDQVVRTGWICGSKKQVI